MKLKHLNKRRTLLVIILLVLDGLFFSLTDPNSVNSILLIFGIILAGITFFAFMDLILYMLSNSGLNLKYRKRLAVYLTILFGILLAEQSIGQLTGRDVIVIVPLSVLVYIYLTYVRPRSSNKS